MKLNLSIDIYPNKTYTHVYYFINQTNRHLIILYKDVDTLERQDPAELLLPKTGRDELSCANLTINILTSNEQIQ